MKRSLFLMALLAVVSCACAGIVEKNAYEFIERYGNKNPVPSSFSICYAHGCILSAEVRLTDEEWSTVRQAFRPDAADAEGERRYIAKAIGIIETIVGRHTGTDGDKGGTFAGIFRKNQMDCMDEAVNTTTYLAMMKNDGLLPFHDLIGTTNRGYFIWRGWPHIAAVIAEKKTGAEYVVDSSFLDNGNPAFIIPLHQWKNGWRPGKD
jgi:hypothetical protein